MSKRLRHLIENQPKIKVAAPVQPAASDNYWFATLAIFFAGVFYFWAYYFFGEIGWRVFSGG
jgi:hypothetical protein